MSGDVEALAQPRMEIIAEKDIRAALLFKADLVEGEIKTVWGSASSSHDSVHPMTQKVSRGHPRRRAHKQENSCKCPLDGLCPYQRVIMHAQHISSCHAEKPQT